VEKRARIEQDHPDMSVQKQCALIGLTRSSYYREPVPETKRNIEIMRLIDEEYTRNPFKGSRQMRDYLRRQGCKVNRKRVQRLMRLMGLVSVSPGKKTSVPGNGHKIYPYLLRKMPVVRPNQVWCSDITYIRLKNGFVYLAAVMDWYSRKILSWEVSATLDDSFCISALERALRRYPKPEIFNTDQGAQFTGEGFTNGLKQQDIRISMNSKGRAIDNFAIERFWRTLKYEDIYLKEYATVGELLKGLRAFMEEYNNKRSHSSLNSRTPSEAYSGLSFGQAA